MFYPFIHFASKSDAIFSKSIFCSTSRQNNKSEREWESERTKRFNRFFLSVYACLISILVLRFPPFLKLEKAHFRALLLFWWEKSESFSRLVSLVVMINVNKETKTLTHNWTSVAFGLHSCSLGGLMIAQHHKKGHWHWLEIDCRLYYIYRTLPL